MTLKYWEKPQKKFVMLKVEFFNLSKPDLKYKLFRFEAKIILLNRSSDWAAQIL